ncbi:MAG: CpsD/CapB family tyrosine-protein kinase [Pyrinomonadaceae bacterium]
MGRVFDAIKRSSAADQNGAKKRHEPNLKRHEESPNVVSGSPSAGRIEEQLSSRSSFLSASHEAAPNSASSAHTANVPGGLALPGGIASRDAGATLGAAGSARVGGFASYDISAARVEPHLVAVTQPRSPYCEQFRSLRTKLLQAGERNQMRAFVVTSAGVGEGKTLTALNLAWLLAQTEGMRALVIDSDLRQPCATDYLGIDASLGLSDVLGGTAALQEAIVRLDPAGLYLLPGGQARDDVAELLSGPSYARILTDVRKMFDYIIIDAPPLGIFTDANVLMNRADGALIVVRSGKTRYTLVDRLLEQIPQEKLLGVILNRVDDQIDDSSSYYYQRRYYNRGREISDTNVKQLPDERQEEVTLVN